MKSTLNPLVLLALVLSNIHSVQSTPLSTTNPAATAIPASTTIQTLPPQRTTTPPPSTLLQKRQQTSSSTPSPTSPTTTTVEATPSTGRKGYFLTTKYITIEGFTNAHATKHAQTITIALPTCIQTSVPDRNGYVPPGTCGSLYNYYPSFAAALATAVLFGALTVGHVVLGVWYRSKFCWVIVMGSLWETIAFGVRAISTHQQQTTSLVLVSQLFVLLVPLWINAFIYILLSHLINFISPSSSILGIPASFLSIIFVFLDIVSFVVQMIGGMLAGPTASQEEQMKGVHIYMGGIGLQQFFIVVFVGIAVKFHLEMKALKRRGRLFDEKKRGWEWLLWAVYAGLGFITIRIIYRLIEFSAGHDKEKNPLPYKEVYLYVLEVLPMFLAVLVFIIVHPGRVLVGPEAEMKSAWKTLKDMRGERGGRGRRGEKIVGKELDDEGVELVQRDGSREARS